jgi:RNA polymerase sigma factor for flagellar operon FliA
VGTDWSNDPARLLEERSRRETIGAAVDALPARQRRVIREHYYGEWSLREVGRRMRISPQRASQLHIAAMKKLRRSLHAAAS